MFYIKQNDTSPAYQGTCQDKDGQAVNVTGATVRFLMRLAGSDTIKVNGVGSLVTPASGIVKYDWIAADTDTVGVYEVEIEITYTDGSVGTFPNKGYDKVKITDDIG